MRGKANPRESRIPPHPHSTDGYDWRSLLCQQPYALRYLILHDTLLLLAASFSFNSSPCLFGELQQFCYHQHQQTEQGKEDYLANEEVVVMLVDKFGLCWRGDLGFRARTVPQ
jgi:hypothetical protein